MNTLVEISFGVSLLIGLLLLCAPLLSKRYSSNWRYWVWIILAVRLLLPFNLSLPAAPIALSASSEKIQFQTSVMAAPQTLVSLSSPSVAAEVRAKNDSAASTADKSAPFALPPLSVLLFVIWFAGAAAFLLRHIVSYLLFWQSIRRYGKCADCDTQRVFDSLKRDMGIGQNIRLFLHLKVASPMLLGFFHPTLLLPNTAFSAEDLSVVLRHELLHFKRRDLWFKALLLLAQSAHWFNPLVHFMAHAACRDIEVSCDEQLLKFCDLPYRKQYGETLLRVIRDGVSPSPSLSTHFYGGVPDMKKRFHSLFDTGKKKKAQR